MRALLVVTLTLLAAAAGGCRSAHLSADENSDAGVEPDAPITDAIGSADTLDVGAWNLKNFPCGNASDSAVCRTDADKTPALVAQLIEALDVDLLAVEEIDSEDAFNEVVSLLPGRDSVLSPHVYFDGTYQKVGFIWKTSVLDAGSASILFNDDNSFPRPPVQVPFTWKGPGQPFSFSAIAVHLKAGGTDQDFARRQESIAHLESYVRQSVDAGEARFIIMGDFNELITDAVGQQIFQPFIDDTRYDIRTKKAADAGAVSFLPGDAVIDHIITTNALNPEIGDDDAVIPRIDADVSDYLGRVSDHLPVFLQLAAP